MNCSVRAVTSLAALALSLGALTACGSDGDDPSATEAACAARQGVVDALNTVKGDLSSANFGQAKEDLPAISDAVDDLKDAVADLADDEKDKLSPEIDAVKESYEAAKSPSSITDLQSSLGELNSNINVLVSAIASDLDCS